MSENDRPNLVLVAKDGKVVASPPSGKTRKVFAVLAEGIKDEGGPRKGDFSCTVDTIEALQAANLPLSMVGLALEGKGIVNWVEGEISITETNLIEETREDVNKFAAFNTVDRELIPDQHLLNSGPQNQQALVQVSQALAKSNIQPQGKVISAALVIREIKPASTQTLPEMKPSVEESSQPSNVIEIGTGKWSTIIPDKKVA